MHGLFMDGERRETRKRDQEEGEVEASLEGSIIGRVHEEEGIREGDDFKA